MEEIMEAFHQIHAGGISVVVIRGSAGCGKSALLQGVRQLQHAEAGNQVYGHFVPTAASMPYAVLFEAFGNAMAGLLGQPDEQVAGWRERLLSRLGEDVLMLEPLIPHLSTVLGEHDVVVHPSLARPTADDIRRAINKLLSVFASEEQPVVLCLDMTCSGPTRKPWTGFAHYRTQMSSTCWSSAHWPLGPGWRAEMNPRAPVSGRGRPFSR